MRSSAASNWVQSFQRWWVFYEWHCRFQCKAPDSPTVHQSKWTRICGTVEWAVVGVLELWDVRISVLQMSINIATQGGCQGLVVSFYLLIVLWVMCRDENITDLLKLTYTLEKLRCKLFPLCESSAFGGSYLYTLCSKNAYATSTMQMGINDTK